MTFIISYVRIYTVYYILVHGIVGTTYWCNLKWAGSKEGVVIRGCGHKGVVIRGCGHKEWGQKRVWS